MSRPLSQASCRIAAGRIPATLALAACAAVAVAAAGCEEAGRNLTPIQGLRTFQSQVLKADRPVLIEFNKTNCPTCVAQAAELDKLADEYQGRVVFLKMLIMNETFGVIEPELRDQYKLYWVPTTILFVNGQEKKRWVFNHLPIEFRGDLDQAIAATAGSRPPVSVAGPDAAPPVPSATQQPAAVNPR